MSTPAGNPGGDTTTPIAAALAELPARIRVHAFAKLLGRSSREVLAAITELGADGRSVQSSVDRELALRVAEALGVTAPDPKATPEPDPGENGAATPQAETAQQPAGSRQQTPGFRQAPGFTAPARDRTAPAAPAQGESPARVIPPTPVFASASPLFLPPEPTAPPQRPARPVKEEPPAEVVEEEEAEDTEETFSDAEDSDEGRPRRRRGRRGRGRGKGGQDDAGADELVDDEPKPDKQEKPDKPGKRVKVKDEPEVEDTDEQESSDGEDSASRRRRRRRRRRGGDGEDANGNATEDDPPNTVVHVREAREDKERDKPESDGRDEVRSVRGSTRLEAKRQRRRDGREAGRRRAPILSEAEFLARREAVDRAMVVRERGDRIQIGVLEDGVLVEHFVTSAGTGSLVGNVYLGRVQNVLPSMEAAFVDIGRGRNAVLYAGEVDWDAAGLEGKARKIEQALSTGDSVLVQVTKDPVGHKGARLTTQISLPGRFLVYVPGGGATGISRKLPENERRRLKDVLKRVVPEDAGVIIRTASEGISEEELARDVRRLQAQWQVIKDKTEGTNGVRRVGAPSLVYEEPDLLVKVVRDLFTEDFSALVVQGDLAWETVDAYVRHVAPELADRLRKHATNADVFSEYRIDEQLLKALDRKVWLPSGGYLVIDRTEAMTVIDVNTGKFTGSGGNLEETVTRNNLESAEEIVRQLRLRDIGGIIVIDFIDMVLESNRDLVLRRLTECLGRDRTRHQVAEVTSLGLVQMTRKRVGTGLLEAFGTTCEHCKGRGVLVTTDPVSKPASSNGNAEPARGTRRSRGRSDEGKDAKPQNKDAAKEAAAQAAKEAVRDIAKAITKTAETPLSPDEAEPTTEQAEPTQGQTPERQPSERRTRERQTRGRHTSERQASEVHSREGQAHEDQAHEDQTHADQTHEGQATRPAESTSTRTRHRTRSRRGESRNGSQAGHDRKHQEASAAEEQAEQPTTATNGVEGHTDPSSPNERPQEHANGRVAHLTDAPADPGAPASTTWSGSGPSASQPDADEPAGAPGTPASEPTLVTTSETTSATSGTASGTAERSSETSSAIPGETPYSGTPSEPELSSPETAATSPANTSTEAREAAVAPGTMPEVEARKAPGATPGDEARVATPEAPMATPEVPAAAHETRPDSPEAHTHAPRDVTPEDQAHGTPEVTSETQAHGTPDVTAEAEASEASEASGAPDGTPEVDAAEAPETPSVPAPATPPRRQPRRAASRPAGPPVSARHDG